MLLLESYLKVLQQVFCHGGAQKLRTKIARPDNHGLVHSFIVFAHACDFAKCRGGEPSALRVHQSLTRM